MSEICTKLAIKIPENVIDIILVSALFIFQQIPHIFLVFLLITLNVPIFRYEHDVNYSFFNFSFNLHYKCRIRYDNKAIVNLFCCENIILLVL